MVFWFGSLRREARCLGENRFKHLLDMQEAHQVPYEVPSDLKETMGAYFVDHHNRRRYHNS